MFRCQEEELANWGEKRKTRGNALKNIFAITYAWRGAENREGWLNCDTLKIHNYTQHDARHTYAVRAIEAGASFEHVASQLGHADTQMVVKVYGRFHPSAAERTAWENRATEMDRVRTRSRRGPTKGGGRHAS